MDFDAKELTLIAVGLTLYAIVQTASAPIEVLLLPLLFTPGAIVTGLMSGIMPSRVWWTLYALTRVDFLLKLSFKLTAFADIKLGFPGIQIPLSDHLIPALVVYCVATELAGPFMAHWAFKRVGLYRKISAAFTY